jgi:AhpD family alkylhydroperoxidase
MKEHISYAKTAKIQPTLVQSLLDIGEAVGQKLELPLIYLVKIRVSQINGCGFCIKLNADLARKEGETQTRLDLLAGWHHVLSFSDREKAALAWAEKLTLMPQQPLSDTDYAEVSSSFNESEIVNLTAIIVTINSWNRIAASFGYQP